MSEIIEIYLIGRTVDNTYLEGIEGKFIMLPDITKGKSYDEFNYIWTKLNRIANKFNSGNIIHIEKSKKDIEYKAYLQSINDEETYDIVTDFEKIKKERSQYGDFYKRVSKYLKSQGLSDKEIKEIMNKDKPI